jgi:lipopolysaccharide transport system permease protein
MNHSATAPTAPRSAPRYILEGKADTWGDRGRLFGLVRQMTRRHLAARYRGSALGFLWSMLNPVMMMLVYTVVFQYVLRFKTTEIPYPAFFLTGILAWNFIHVATMNAAVSIIDNQPLIHQAYFPRVALPLAAVFSNAANYLVALPILLLFNLLFGIVPGPTLLLLPLAMLYLLALALALGLIFACVTPFFRDLIQLLELGFIAWFFGTPVLYPISFPAENLSVPAFVLYRLNPATGAISLVRAAFLGESVAPATLIYSTISTLILLVLAVGLFRRLAPRFSSVT